MDEPLPPDVPFFGHPSPDASAPGDPSVDAPVPDGAVVDGPLPDVLPPDDTLYGDALAEGAAFGPAADDPDASGEVVVGEVEHVSPVPVSSGPLQLSPNDFVFHRMPSRCDLRTRLRDEGVQPGSPSPFDELLARLGTRQQELTLDTLQPVVNLSEGTVEQRAQWTRDEVKRSAPVIYDGMLAVEVELGGHPCRIVAEPHFLIRGDTGYIIRQSVSVMDATQTEHHEIVLQMQLFGWLFGAIFGVPPQGLEVVGTEGRILPVAFDSGDAALRHLTHVVERKTGDEYHWDPVCWDRCWACVYFRHCFPPAVERRDVATVLGVDQGLARALHDDGIDTADQLLERFDETSLAAHHRPVYGEDEAIGDAVASRVLRNARSLVSGESTIVSAPDLLLSDNYAALACETLPWLYDEYERVYAWGVQVFGTLPSPHTAAMAGCVHKGDRQGWLAFLSHAETLLRYYGNIPFLYWDDRVPDLLDSYMTRLDDPMKIGLRVRRNLVHLKPLVTDSVSLPLPSDRLRAVAQHAGLQQGLDEFSRDWSLAKYIEAVETGNESQRMGVTSQVQAYNRDDLEAMHGVLRWLMAKVAERR